MTDAEFLDHCEQLCARHDAFGMVEFPLDDHKRFVELADRFTTTGVFRGRVKAAIRLETLRRIRGGMAAKVRARLTR
jgi:hypothetical protein